MKCFLLVDSNLHFYVFVNISCLIEYRFFNIRSGNIPKIRITQFYFFARNTHKNIVLIPRVSITFCIIYAISQFRNLNTFSFDRSIKSTIKAFISIFACKVNYITRVNIKFPHKHPQQYSWIIEGVSLNITRSTFNATIFVFEYYMIRSIFSSFG